MDTIQERCISLELISDLETFLRLRAELNGYLRARPNLLAFMRGMRDGEWDSVYDLLSPPAVPREERNAGDG